MREAKRDFSQFGLQVISSQRKVVGMGGEGTERGQSIRWAPTPKGAFTAPEEVGVIYLWMQILVLPLTGLF